MKVVDCYLDFMNKGLNFLKDSNYDFNLSEPNMGVYLKVVNFIKEQFHAITLALEISFMYSQ